MLCGGGRQVVCVADSHRQDTGSMVVLSEDSVGSVIGVIAVVSTSSVVADE